MSVEGGKSEQDDFDKFLNEFDAELNTPNTDNTNKVSAEDDKGRSKSPAKLKSGIPLPLSPELPRSILRRNSRNSSNNNSFMTNLFGGDDYNSRGKNISTAESRRNPSVESALTSASTDGNKSDGRFPTRPVTTASVNPSKNMDTPESITAKMNTSTKYNASADWLGLGPQSLEDANSGLNTPNKVDSPALNDTRKTNQSSTPSFNSKPILPTKLKPNKLEDTDDFFKSLSLDELKYKPPTQTKVNEPKPIQNTSARRVEDAFLDNLDKSKPNVPQNDARNINESEQPNVNLNQTNQARQMEPKTPQNEPQMSPKQQFQNQPSSSSLLDNLSFLKKKTSPPVKKAAATRRVVQSDEVVDEISGSQSQPHHKLHIPTHILDEDELKTMSSSVKSLYCNQLELLENSYKEQLHCLTQSHQRKEEILKDEIHTLHKDHAERLYKLRTEAQETNESNRINLNNNPKLQQEIQSLSAIVEELKQIKNHTQSLIVNSQSQSHLQESNKHEHDSSEQLLSPMMIEKFTKDVQNSMALFISTEMASVLSSNHKQLYEMLNEKLSQSSSNKNEFEKSNTEFRQGFKEIVDKLNGIDLSKNEKFDLKLQGLEKRLELEFNHLNKIQKKYRNSIVKNVLSSVTDSMEIKVNENEQKKEQIKSQLKEFRKDFKRLAIELENKHESVHRSQTTLESEQKQISHSLQNLNSWLQVSWTQQTASTMGLREGVVGHGHGQHGQQSSLQSELELKLLREERNGLSEAVAHLNVEKRKLNDERIALEQDKYKLEHDKSRVFELETSLKLRSNDLDDIKLRSDVARQEYTKISNELGRKLQEFDQDSAKQKETISVIEQKFRSREKRLNQHKIEVQREKEFLEKLRNQMLCPNCLILNPEPSTRFRSRGDGLEFSSTNTSSLVPQPQHYSAFKIDEGALLDREIKYLDDMYYKYFASK